MAGRKMGIKLKWWQTFGLQKFLQDRFLGSKLSVDGDYSHDIIKTFAPWKKSYGEPRQCIKKAET